MSGEGTNIELDGTMAVKLADLQLNGDSLQSNGDNLFNIGSSMNDYFAISNGTKIYADTTALAQRVHAIFTETDIIPTEYDTTDWLWCSQEISLTPNTRYHIRAKQCARFKIMGFTSLDGNTTGTTLYEKSTATTNLDVHYWCGATQYNHYVFTFYPSPQGDNNGGGVVSNLSIETAPTPDNPIPIQVVTGTQDVTVRGKNFFNLKTEPTIVGGTGDMEIIGSTIRFHNITGGYANNRWLIGDILPTDGSYVDITISCYINPASVTGGVQSAIYLGFTDNVAYENTANKGGVYRATGKITKTIRVKRDSANPLVYLALYSNYNGVNNTNGYIEYSDVQVEFNLVATPYDTPMQEFQIDLGDTELCKVGQYRDAIYNVGDDWYLHKEVGKWIIDENSTVAYSGGDLATVVRCNCTVANQSVQNGGSGYGLCDKLYTKSGWNNDSEQIYTGYNNQFHFFLKRTRNITDLATLQSWLAENNLTCYWAMYAPTNTKITDATLLASLNGLGNALGADGKTYIEITPSDTNLATPLKVVAYKKSLAGIIANL